MTSKTRRTEVLRSIAIAFVAAVPYLDALTDPVKTNEQITDITVAIVVAIVACLFVVDHITKPVSVGLQSLRRLSPIAPLALLAAVFWVSYFANPSELGYGKCMRITFMVIPFSAGFVVLLRKPDDIRLPLFCLFWLGLFISLVSVIFNTVTPFVFLSYGHDTSLMHRVYGRYGTFGVLASCTAIIAIIMFCESSPRMNILKRSLYLVAAAIGVAGSIKSGERASLIVVIVAVLLYLAYLCITFRDRKTVVVAGRMGIVLALIVVSGLLVAFSPQAHFFWRRWEHGGNETRFNLKYGAYIAPLLPNLKSSPILGVGPQNYFRNSNQPIENYPHNMLWEIVGETGMVGFVAYIAILFTLFRGLSVAYWLHRRDPKDGIYLAASALMIVFLLRTFKAGNVPRCEQFWAYWAYFSWLSEIRFAPAAYTEDVHDSFQHETTNVELAATH